MQKRSAVRAFALVAAAAALGGAGFLYDRRLDVEAARARADAEALAYQQQRQCTLDGGAWAEEYRRLEQSAAYNFELAEWSTPQFHYSPALQACLVRTRSVDFRDDLIWYEHQRVTDITANRPILESSVRLVTDRTAVPGTPPKEEPSPIVRVLGENLTRAEFARQADAAMASGR
ncbi:MAG: hypothetical protein IT176_07050 [Acidobacteria bacterium]|nr:hypothetical protein [Acidobacteriota bacterium]